MGAEQVIIFNQLKLSKKSNLSAEPYPGLCYYNLSIVYIRYHQLTQIMVQQKLIKYYGNYLAKWILNHWLIRYVKFRLVWPSLCMNRWAVWVYTQSGDNYKLVSYRLSFENLDIYLEVNFSI